MEDVAEYLKERICREFAEITDDIKRSRKALQFYIDSVAKFKTENPDETEYEITDAPNDGGLDGYLIDRVDKEIHLFQCKWFQKPKKISKKDSLDLHRFYTLHLAPDCREELSDPVKAFMGRYQTHYKKWKVRLFYVINGTLDPIARKNYRKLRIEFSEITPDQIGTEYQKILQEHEEIKNMGVFSLITSTVLPLKVKFPINHGIEKVNVFQCVIRGIDLKRAWDVHGPTILSRNLRYELKGKINRLMAETARSSRRTAFYVLHNGISITCSDFKLIDSKGKAPSYIPDNELSYIKKCKKRGIESFVYLKDFQIVNGGQTTATLAGIDDRFLEKIAIPCKIAKTRNFSIASEIAVCNNTQNRIGPWDLVTNSEKLIFLQNYCAKLEPPVFFNAKEARNGVKLDSFLHQNQNPIENFLRKKYTKRTYPLTVTQVRLTVGLVRLLRQLLRYMIKLTDLRMLMQLW